MFLGFKVSIYFQIILIFSWALLSIGYVAFIENFDPTGVSFAGFLFELRDSIS